MVELWDTFGLFRSLLDDFESLLNCAPYLRTTEPENSLALKASLVGFSQFSPISAWGREHFAFMDARLQGEMSGAALNWHTEYAEPISVFGCLSLGALLGKFEAGDIDDAGFLMGDAHLHGFMSLHTEEIGRRYSVS